MQLHPNDKTRAEEYQILDRGYIGLGDWDDKRPTSQIIQFKDEMKKGDIVLIKRGEKPFALVEVIGDSEEGDGVGGNDWIYYKRDIKLLDKNVLEMPTFPQPRGTLQKSISPKTDTYKYIDKWYKKVSYAMKSIYIEDYKMFKDLNIDFVDENNKALPVVVIAGINGSGKTSLLEYINKLSDNTIYFPVGSNKIENIKETILKKYIDRAFEIDKPSEALRELQVYIKTIFDGLDLTFNLSRINYNEKKVLFQDNSGNEFDISQLSTGEKTLLSKILYLFFENYKNKIILIDEPELSLHPSWQNKILQVYKKFADKNNCQIIIATHSPHIIGSANPEYLRILKKVDNKIEVLDNIDRSYGLEFDKILTDIMGVENLRTPEVAKDIKRLWELLEDEDYEGEEYIKLYSELEDLLGSLDEDLLLARLEIAKIKSQNAQSK